MVRKIPYGVRVGHEIELLVPSTMTNGETALAKTPYRVSVVYPGGVVVESDEPGVPVGLVKSGTPVWVRGEEPPTDEELAELVHSGHLPTSTLKKETSDAADFARSVASGYGYRVDPEKKLATPRQASILCEIIAEIGEEFMSEGYILRVVRDQGARLNTSQDPERVYKYYKKALLAAGFLGT